MKKQASNESLPTWLTEANHDPLQVSKPGFVHANLATVMRLVHYFAKTRPDYQAKSSAWVRLVVFIFETILIVLARNPLFLWLLGLLLGFNLVLLPGPAIRKISQRVLKLLAFTALFVLPSVLLGNTNLPLFLTRTGLIVLNLATFMVVTPWQDFMRALRQLRFPGVLILTMDITMKYVYVLADFLQELLASIRLRTLGQHVDRQLMGVIIGHLYLYSKQRMAELYQAMQLRGYGRVIQHQRTPSFNQYDGYHLAELVAVVMIFIMVH